MIADLTDLLESSPVADPARSGKPWLLVAASALLAVLLLYVFFGAYLPARQHGARLES